MTRREPKKPIFGLDRMLLIGIPLVTFLGGMLFNAFTIADRLATKPYVDDRFDTAKKYTDERVTSMLERAFDHSDRNFQNMRLLQEQLSSDVKSQSVKLDMVLQNLGKLPQKHF